MSFNAIYENKILAKVSEFTVEHGYQIEFLRYIFLFEIIEPVNVLRSLLLLCFKNSEDY